MNVNYYWVNKKGRAEIAYNHTQDMKNKFNTEINNCIKNSKIYSFENEFEKPRTFKKMSVTICSQDSVGAIMEYAKGKTAILNFASYKEPGGGFLAGSRAQEESLCHESYLYNVLRDFPEYYNWNSQHKNFGMYLNRAIYTPQVRFERDVKSIFCDVITCAAPNYSVGKKYGNVDVETNSKWLDSRIKFVLDIAADQKVDTLILGAFGCGVFCQDATEVITIFKKYLSTTHKSFKHIIFAIPQSVNSENYIKAYRVLKND